MSHPRSTHLEDENRRLAQQVQQLLNELSQKDSLIISLEAQIKNLIEEEEVINGRKESSTKAMSSRLGLPPKAPHKNNSRTTGRGDPGSDDDSTPPPKPRTRPSLDPPTRSQVEMSSPLPDQTTQTRVPAKHPLLPKHSPLLLNREDLLQSGEGTVLDESIAKERSEEIRKLAEIFPQHNEAADFSSRRILHKVVGAIKALPRELSIYNSEDDDVTKYSIEDNMPTYDLEKKTEMRDAYNARGLYSGTVSRADQMPDGRGRMEYHHQGRIYEGDWIKGHWHGMGQIRNANGDIFEGKIVNDLREGEGRLVYADGRIFQGRFQQDDPVQGTLTFPDGAKYVGELHNGTRHGFGVYFFTDNSKYEGYSVMNIFEGKGTMTWSDGGWYEGEWLQGEIHGYGKEIRADRSLRHNGQWSKGVPIRL